MGGDDDSTKTPPRGGVVAAFRKSLSKFPISGNEFHAQIDASRKTKKKPGAPSKFGLCVKESVRNIMKQLRSSDDYAPFFLTDEVMGIHKYAAVCGDAFLDSTDRARYRRMFKE